MKPNIRQYSPENPFSDLRMSTYNLQNTQTKWKSLSMVNMYLLHTPIAINNEELLVFPENCNTKNILKYNIKDDTCMV